MGASISQPHVNFSRTVTGTEQLLDWMRVNTSMQTDRRQALWFTVASFRVSRRNRVDQLDVPLWPT